MKKLLFVFAMMLAMVACTGNTAKTTITNDSTVVDSIEVVDSVDSAMVDTICVD